MWCLMLGAWCLELSCDDRISQPLLSWIRPISDAAACAALATALLLREG